MFKHDGKARRKPLVYGKARRSTPAYNPFEEDDISVRRTQSNTSSSRQDESKLEKPQIRGQVVKPIEASPKTKLSNIRQRTLSKQQPIFHGVTSHGGSGLNNERSNSQAAFDFPSDEEDGTILFQESMQKRRRLTPVRNGGTNVKVDQAKPIWSHTKTDVNEEPQPLRARAPRLQAKTKAKSPPRAPQQFSQKPRTPSPEEDRSVARPSLCNTPKQTKLLSNLLVSAGPADSPSKLPLTSLSLTNTEITTPELVEPGSKTPLNTERGQGRILQSKKRLIDAMASPRKRSSVSESSEASSEGSAMDAVSDSSELRKDSQPAAAGNVNEANGMAKARDVIPNGAFTALNVALKPRMTYSRERSHLADMLSEDALDPANQSTSQEDSLQLSQNGSIFGSFDVAIPHEAADEDLEQEIVGIRSIHELRHAGSNARSRVDLESILEDIEAKGSSSRARRLRGLTQLTEKLDKPEIGRQILEEGLDQRLSQCPLLEGDVVGQTLLTIALCRLMISVQLPITSLKGILEAVMSSGMILLQEPGLFVKIVRDRKQNLSKATCRDINSLVEPFRLSLVWPDRRPNSLSPRLVFTRLLDNVLRQVRRLGDFDVVLPASIFNEVVELLLQIEPTQLDDTKETDPMLMMELAVSIIESLTLSKNWAEEGCLEIAKRLSELGPLLSQLTSLSSESVDRTHHLILRLILNITNNDSDLCDAFAKPALLSAIFDIVRRDFIETSILAHGVLKESRLEGVILALGALSNLAEHSSSFRQTMLDNLIDNISMVDWVAYAFRDQVEQASEVRILPQADCSLFADVRSGFFCRTDHFSCRIWVPVSAAVQSLYQ
jgi:Wings apart-like protein regulation of heterochromatin